MAPLFLTQACAQECDLREILPPTPGRDNNWAASQLRQWQSVYATMCKCATGHCGVTGLRVNAGGLIETQAYLGCSWITTPYQVEAYIYLFLSDDDVTDHTWIPHPAQ